MKYSLIHNRADGITHYGFNWCLDAGGLELVFCVPIVNINMYLRIRSEEVMQRLPSNALPGRVIFDVIRWEKS